MREQPSPYRQREIANHADDLFERLYFWGQITKWLARFRGKSRALPLLSEIEKQYPNVPVTQLGDQPVRLEQIIGTTARRNFDCDFHPLQRRTKNRWTGIARTMIAEPTSLPSIAVVQVGPAYYVTDGNHRVSVARALKHLYIDGNVTRWEID
jgi:hypothetical protein